MIFIAQHLSLPRQREAAALASEAEWGQAQRDFQRVLATIIRTVEVQGQDVREWGPLRYNLVAILGIHCILADLALREAAYAHWIERALLFMDVINQYLDTGAWKSALAMRPDEQE